MGFFDSWFGYRSAPIYSSESVHPREPTHREYRTHTRYAPRPRYLPNPPIFTKYTCHRPQEYVTREPRGPRRGDRHVRFESPPEYSPEYGRTRPASPTFDRMPEPGRRYETRMPRREGLRTQFDREPAGYSYTPPRPQPQRRGYAPPPPRPNVIVREPQVVKQGLRGITRSAQNALNRGPRPFYF